MGLPGQLVTIAGCADSNYNGVYPVATVTVPDTFTYTVANSGAATCVGTAVTATPALPANALVTETFRFRSRMARRPVP